MMSTVSADDLGSIARTEEHLRALRELDPASLMSLPLLARGRLLGALVLVSSHPSRRYDPQDFRLGQELAHRAALAIENARLYQAAQRAIQAREEVLSIVAHDLRNPIHASQFAATVLRQQLPEEGAEKARKSVETIVRSSKRAIHLIQDLLDVARIEAGHLSIEQDRVPAERIVIDAVESQELLARKCSSGCRIRARAFPPRTSRTCSSGSTRPGEPTAAARGWGSPPPRASSRHTVEGSGSSRTTHAP